MAFFFGPHRGQKKFFYRGHVSNEVMRLLKTDTFCGNSDWNSEDAWPAHE